MDSIIVLFSYSYPKLSPSQPLNLYLKHHKKDLYAVLLPLAAFTEATGGAAAMLVLAVVCISQYWTLFEITDFIKDWSGDND